MTEEIHTEMVQEKNKKNPYLIPGAIVIAGALVAFAIIAQQARPEQGKGNTSVVGTTEIKEEVLPVTEEDHILGSTDPDVYLIEYSDYRCGYCGVFHATIKQVLEEYEGRVAWVYRHTPYQPGGKEAAVASECIAEQLGEDGFWKYTEKAFENQRVISEDWSRATALELGADQGKYDECVASGRYDALISKYTMNAQGIGSQGTPYNVLLTREGGVVKFSGAQPIENVRMFVDRALGSL